MGQAHSLTRQLLLVSVCLLIFVLVIGMTATVAAGTPASNTTEFVVVFEDPDAATFETGDDPVTVLQEHAANKTGPLQDWAANDSTLTVEETYWIAPAAVVSLNTTASDPDQLANLSGVNAIKPDSTVVQMTHGSMTASEQTSGLKQIGAAEAWAAFETRGEGASVAVLDTGIDGTHSDLSVAKWKDFSDDPAAEPHDYDNHGTHVAGTIAGGETPGGEAYGVAPGVDLYVGAIATDCDPRCNASLSTVLEGLEWAVAAEADVISMSFGAENYSVPLINASRHATEAGTTPVGAVGNLGEGTSLSPANVLEVIAVGATDDDREVWRGSSGETIDTDDAWGTDAPDDWPDEYVVPDVVAPGVDVLSAVPDDDYATKTGTSMATPHVSGTVALMQAATVEHLSPAEIRTALTATAVHPDEEVDTRFGHGIVDAPAAIGEAREPGTITAIVQEAATGDEMRSVTVRVVAADRELAETDTGVDGSATIEGVPSRSDLTLVVDAPGYERYTTNVALSPGGVETRDIELAGNATVTVAATDRVTSTPLETASISVERGDGTVLGQAETDATGSADVRVPGTNEEYAVIVSRPGFDDTAETVRVGDAETVEVPIAAAGAGAVTVSVEDSVLGSRVASPNVSLSSDRGDYPGSAIEDGTAIIEDVPTYRSYVLTTSATGYETATTNVDDVTRDTTLGVRLDGDASVQLTIEDEITGAQLDNVSIAIDRDDGATARDVDRTDADGTTTVPLAGTGKRYTLTGVHPGYGNASVDVTPEPGQDLERSLSLEGSGALTVQPVDALFDALVEDATVIAESDRGSYSLERSAPGEYRHDALPSDVTYTLRGSAPGYLDGDVETEKLDGQSVRLPMDGSGTLEIAVESSDGEPIEGANVTISGAQGTASVAQTDSDGTTSAAVPGVGEPYTVTATADGYVGANETIEDLQDGDTETVTVRLEADGGLSGFGPLAAIGAIFVVAVGLRRTTRLYR